MKKNVWYISKYFEVPTRSSPGGRPFLVLRELVKNGYDTTVITSNSNHLMYFPEFKGTKLEQEIDGVRLLWLNTLRIKKAASLRRILSWFHFEANIFFLKKKNIPRPDLIIVSSLSLLTVLSGLWLRKKYGCKLAFEVRDIWPLTLTEEGGYSKKNIFVKLLAIIEKIGYQKSDYIIGTMPNLDEHVENILGYSRPVFCLPMGVPDSVMNISTDLVDKGYFDKYFPTEKFFVVYAGTIGITNALDVFFECAKKMERIDDIHFVILGDGGLKETYVEKYKKLSNLTFADRVEKYQVQSILKKADILYLSTFPSEIWRYGQSLNKLIDYMLAGKVVVASYSGYPSMLNEANSGYFIPAGDVNALEDKIVALRSMSYEERTDIGMRGREWLLENRNYKRIAERFISEFLL